LEVVRGDLITERSPLSVVQMIGTISTYSYDVTHLIRTYAAFPSGTAFPRARKTVSLRTNASEGYPAVRERRQRGKGDKGRRS
jgi:hypothetical protein